jgi:hypothetical protein
MSETTSLAALMYARKVTLSSIDGTAGDARQAARGRGVRGSVALGRGGDVEGAGRTAFESASVSPRSSVGVNSSLALPLQPRKPGPRVDVPRRSIRALPRQAYVYSGYHCIADTTR